MAEAIQGGAKGAVGSGGVFEIGGDEGALHAERGQGVGRRGASRRIAIDNRDSARAGSGCALGDGVANALRAAGH